MKASSTRSRFFPGLPSAAFGALLTLADFRLQPRSLQLRRHHHADRYREEKRHHDGGLRHRARKARRQDAPQEAVYEGCLIRFRPIMMTTMAALMGTLPIAFGTWRRRRFAPSAGPCRRRRPAFLAARHALPHARCFTPTWTPFQKWLAAVSGKPPVATSPNWPGPFPQTEIPRW